MNLQPLPNKGYFIQSQDGPCIGINISNNGSNHHNRMRHNELDMDLLCGLRGHVTEPAVNAACDVVVNAACSMQCMLHVIKVPKMYQHLMEVFSTLWLFVPMLFGRLELWLEVVTVLYC